MVNVFQRLVRRATTGSGDQPRRHSHDTGAPTYTRSGSISGVYKSNDLHRTTSGSSWRRRPHAAMEEPSPRHLILISDNATFDPHIIQRFEAEGFDVTYLGFVCTDDAERDRKALESAVHEKEDDLEPGERYAIVAYNRPAYYLLGSHHLSQTSTNPFPRLCAFIAYYPLDFKNPAHSNAIFDTQECCAPACEDTSAIFDPSVSTSFLPIQIHLPGHDLSSRTFWPWISTSPGERDITYKKRHRCHVYAYPDARAGFAESTPSSYSIKDKGPVDDDRISAQLAWSRALGCLRHAFGARSTWPIADIETVWEQYWARLMDGLNLVKMASSQPTAHGSAMEIVLKPGNDLICQATGGTSAHDEQNAKIICAPTKAGGSTPEDLRTFFKDVFIPNGPPSQHFRLLSRTVGADRIVDELLFTFCHSKEVPWLLPRVPPTNRDIEVVIVVVASFFADRIVHQSLYWDQADVLVQAGLLDADLVPHFHRKR
ncbi:hypothetical protein N7539_004957 [Penicillium diatomitis]|uniref:Dienelactone hydrolase n=1 Tax=Penicillium diatomitis TaxID=2819901 RepID=A0A9W9X6C8_9EURO|nr:uncharacterized protein N7539_004957 [Penicillium diatomitis]KAJ5484969.1 hypothetical protein N7539_004957 [Penicillium diatomitis]